MASSPAFLGGAPTLAADAHVHWPVVDAGVRATVDRVLARGVLSGASAPESAAFEREFAAFAGAKYALLTHSGTSALHLALVAAGIGEGDHVIVPAYSFVATPLAVVHAGAIPIFADVDEATGLVTAETIARVLTPRTRAVMPVHVHGCSLALGPILALAQTHKLLVIEDAAQAHGATWQGRPVGALGTAGAFSLQSSKNLGIGEGGVLVTNDDAIAEAANSIRSFGQNLTLPDRLEFDADRPLDGSKPLASGRIGWMYRGNELAAAVARASLVNLPERTRLCQENAARLTVALARLPGVLPPVVPPGATTVHHKFRVRFDLAAAGVDAQPKVFRDALARALRAEGCEVVLWQNQPLPSHPVFQERVGYGHGFPWTADPTTDFAAQYAPAHFTATQRLLDHSLLLFSQTCPMIAQPAATVDAYAVAFARVWAARARLANWAASQE